MRIFRAIRNLFGRSKNEIDMQEELAFHIEAEVEKNIRMGMPENEARRRALIDFGGLQQTRERVRDVRGIRLLEVLVQDVRYSLRLMRKSLTFTCIAVLTLALGIGMNTAIFSVIDAVLFRSLPARDPENLLVLKWAARREPTTDGMANFGDCNDSFTQHLTGCSLPLPLLKEIPAHTDVFSSLAASTGVVQLDISGSGPATRVTGQFISGGYFETLGIIPAAGRLLSPADDQPDAAPVAVIDYKLWQGQFSGSPSIIGKTIRLNKKPYTVVGVAEAGFTGLSAAGSFDLWVPMVQQKELAGRWSPILNEMGSFTHTMIGRLKPGIPAGQAAAAASVVFRNATVERERPIFKSEDEPRLKLMPAQKELRGNYSELLRPVYVLMFCVGILLLIACANVAGLLVARAVSRQREIAVRLALGARRSRLLGQLLVESLILSMLGGALGLLTAVWSARLLVARLFSGNPRMTSLSPHLDWRVLMFTAAISILTGIIFGMAPTFRGLRVDLTPSLKTADTFSSAGPPGRRFSLGNLLVAIQVALAVVVLATAGLMVRTVSNLKHLDPGFDTRNLLLFSVNPRLEGYKGPQVGHLYRELQQKFSSLPGVKSVSYSWSTPLSGSQMVTMFHRPGTPVESTDMVKIDINQVGPDFFTTLKIPRLAGRDITPREFEAVSQTAPGEPGKSPAPVMVNQLFASTYYPHQNPLGKIFGDRLPQGPFPGSPGYEIVGVVGNAKFSSVRAAMRPTIYAPALDGPASFALRTTPDPASLVPAVRAALNSVDDNLTVSSIDTQEGQVDLQLSDERMMAQLSTFFGLLALVLACMGLYGLLSYEVTRRTREIGIRMAIGAQSGNVIRMVLGHAALVAVLGALVGAGVSITASRLLKSFLYGVKPGDPLTLICVTVLLAIVALVACLLPARRATRVDPLIALRYE